MSVLSLGKWYWCGRLSQRSPQRCFTGLHCDVLTHQRGSALHGWELQDVTWDLLDTCIRSAVLPPDLSLCRSVCVFIFYSCIVLLLSPKTLCLSYRKRSNLCAKLSYELQRWRRTPHVRSVTLIRTGGNICEMFCLLPITPCTFDPSPLLSSDISTQTPTNMGSMGKRELKRMPSVTWKKKRSWNERGTGYEMYWWPSDRRRESWRKSWRRPLVRGYKAKQRQMLHKFFSVTAELISNITLQLLNIRKLVTVVSKWTAQLGHTSTVCTFITADYLKEGETNRGTKSSSAKVLVSKSYLPAGWLINQKAFAYQVHILYSCSGSDSAL